MSTHLQDRLKQDPPQDERFHILVVDDESGPRELLQNALFEKGYYAVVAKSGDEACQILDETHFELVITDLKMPGLSGTHLLGKIKTHSPDTLVIFITGYASLQSAISAIRQGAYDYLTKPFQLDELYIVVDRARERVKLIRENKLLLEKLREVCEKSSFRAEVPDAAHSSRLAMIQNLSDHLLKVYTRPGSSLPDLS